MGLGRTPRRLKPKHWIAIAVVVLILAFGGFLGLRYAWLVRCEHITLDNTSKIYCAIENWKLDNLYDEYPPVGMSLPDDITAYIQARYLYRVPINPFTGEPVRILEWGATPTHGDITFLQVRERFTLQAMPTIYTDTGFYIFTYSVRGYADYYGRIYIDSDSNGYADPSICCLTTGLYCKRSGYSGGPEDLNTALAQLGYKHDVYTSLPIDTRPFWRWMFFLDP